MSIPHDDPTFAQALPQHEEPEGLSLSSLSLKDGDHDNDDGYQAAQRQLVSHIFLAFRDYSLYIPTVNLFQMFFASILSLINYLLWSTFPLNYRSLRNVTLGVDNKSFSCL
jgi:hypothetical protein